MSSPPTRNESTYSWFLKEGQRLADMHARSILTVSHAPPKSIERFEIQVQEIPGGRASPDSKDGGFDGLADADIHDVYEAMNELIEIARKNEEIEIN